jgi:hypothetical protein
MGVLLALVLVMQTDRGREILKERFTVGFDQRRKERAARFSGKRKRDVDARSDEANEDVEEDNTEDVDLHPIPTEVLIEEEEEDASNQRTVAFVPTARNIKYVWRQIHSHDLTFLLEHIFPRFPIPTSTSASR